MTNKLNYVTAGAESLYDKNEGWAFDLASMPVDFYLINASTFIGGKGVEVASKQFKDAQAAHKSVFCDSGGFQLATGTIEHIDPKGVVEVQNITCDRGFILDVPTMRRAGSAGATGLELDASEEYFNICLKKTQANIAAAKEIERNFRYYAIVQGVTYHQLLRWWEGINGLDSFQGIGTKGVILSQVLNGLFFAETTQIKSHHILGLGAAPRLLLVRYFYLASNKKMTTITYDNTNHIAYGKNMQATVPFTNCTYDKNTEETWALFEEESGVKLLSKPNPILYVQVKNVYYNAMMNKFINMLSTTNTVRDFVDSNYKQVLPYLNCIDDYFDKGIDYVLKRYPDLSVATKSKVSTASLFDF